MTTTKKWGKIEVRLNDDESIDEIVATKIKSFHLEQMSNGHWWMGIERKDGQQLMVNLFNKRDANITCNAQSEDSSICEGFKKVRKIERIK